MKHDIIISGVGGQGVISTAAILAQGAVKHGAYVRQSEIHGMAQRGGGVQVHLRISDSPIASDLIPENSADFILSTEPLESLRYLNYLSAQGILITSSEPVINIPDYPGEDFILEQIQSLPQYAAVKTKELAAKAGAPRSTNIILLGTLSQKLPIDSRLLEESIREKFSSKGTKEVDRNIMAFNLGRKIHIHSN